MERRLRRDEDDAVLQVLRAVQQLHGDTLTKLTEASSQHSETLAVHATILSTLATTQGVHGSSISAASTALAEIRGSVRIIMWVVSIVIPILTVGVNIGLFLLRNQ